MGIASGALAQVTLTNTAVDFATDNVGSVYAATYSISANKFLASNAGTTIRIYNGDTGAYEGDMNITGVNPTGNGIFALTAGTDGSIFGMESGASTLWQWSSTASAPVNAIASGVPFSRAGAVIGTGNTTKVALTGSANNGPITVFSTTDDVTYTLLETIAANAKSTLAINSAITKTWGMPDSSQPIAKTVNTGSWAADAGFVPDVLTNSSTSMVFDEINNVLFSVQASTVYALNADTGALLGSTAITNGFSTTPGYAGGICSPTAGAGTVWFAGRGATATNASLHKLTYTVTAAVSDWSIY
ncbi:hypothetical protein CVU37_03310 [candidate division BRC1 bacterium HGW-BRC1-1]|jgi:hypothetical protein|nr:MAG: hypothetical protein CVU37_03310 [candidate division BRC1 bacterium HGW-BRC1-1]